MVSVMLKVQLQWKSRALILILLGNYESIFERRMKSILGLSISHLVSGILRCRKRSN